MKEILQNLDLAVFAQLSLVLFGGVFVSVFIRAMLAPRGEVDELAHLALDPEDSDLNVTPHSQTGGRP